MFNGCLRGASNTYYYARFVVSCIQLSSPNFNHPAVHKSKESSESLSERKESIYWTAVSKRGIVVLEPLEQLARG